MQYELDFYGIPVLATVREGFVSISASSLSRLFNVSADSDVLAPLAPFIHDGQVTLAAFEKNFKLVAEGIFNGIPGENVPEETTNLLLILKNELVESLIKQLTYTKHILPLIIPPKHFAESGIFTKALGGIEEDYFTLFTTGRLSGHGGTMKIPEDVPFYYVMIQDSVWSFEKQRAIPTNVLRKAIPMHYLSYVITHNYKSDNIPVARPFQDLGPEFGG